jgi:hypothetical protein
LCCENKKRERKSTLFAVSVAVVLAVSAIGTNKRKLLFWCVPFLVVALGEEREGILAADLTLPLPGGRAIA